MGFWLSEDGVRPTKEMLRMIQKFLRPSDVTRVQSWFGLTEQVAWAFSKTAFMDPFRELLQKKEAFSWTP